MITRKNITKEDILDKKKGKKENKEVENRQTKELKDTISTK